MSRLLIPAAKLKTLYNNFYNIFETRNLVYTLTIFYILLHGMN